MKKVLMVIGGIVAILIVVTLVISIKDKIYPISIGIHDDMDLIEGVALNGNDPVSYFTNNNAVKGHAQFAYSWNNANWYFISDSARKLFKAEPEKYAPQFGGYCSLAVSKGFTAHGDANIFMVDDNKLYIFSDAEMKKDFVFAKDENKAIAHSNWNEQ